MTEAKKRLIEVNFPLKEVSEDSVREKQIRHGHISTLHIWWARRPLAASRATILAALLRDDPSQREEYLQLIKDISPWKAVSKETPQSRALLERARKLVLDGNNGQPPKVLDCFAGGGAIPLEALRLGCESYALDYNPVAVLLNKAVLEYPQKFGKSIVTKDVNTGHLGLEAERTVFPLLEEVKSWGSWILKEVQKELAPFYPNEKDGRIPVGYIWARTLPCQNAECGVEIPLLHHTWLATGEKTKVAFRLLPDKKQKRIRFVIAEEGAIDFDPDLGTVSGAHVKCPMPDCGGTISDEKARELFGKGMAKERLVAVVLHHPDTSGKSFRLAESADDVTFQNAARAIEVWRQKLATEWGVDPVPDETIVTERPSPNARGLSAITRYEIGRWGELFNARQRLSLVVLAQKIREAHSRMLARNYDKILATAVSTYLALAADRVADYNSSLCTWSVEGGFVYHTFARQALAMVWDYFEINPISGSTGDWNSAIGWVERVLSHCCSIDSGSTATVMQGSATSLRWQDSYFDAVITDPPYYDNVPYSDLSDFFYVWLKRSVGNLYPDLFATPLSPKSQEIVWHQRHGGSYEAGKEFFEKEIAAAFREVHRVLKPEGIAVVVFAHKTTEAWEVILKALLAAGIYMTGSWPIHTEMETRKNAQETASLASSVYMVCRKRTSKEVGEFPRVKTEIQTRIHEKLEKFWNEGIRGADFFMSAIGPAVEVFGRYERVEKLSGDTVSVAELLDYVERVVSEFALERILGSAELGGVDPETRFYLLWRWTYNSSRVAFDEARKLATAVGAEITSLWGDGQFVRKENEFVRALGPKEREKDKKFAVQIGFNTMVDALHRACIYWERGERKQLKEHLAQTYGANNIFWRVAQNIADVLPDGDKEKQLLQGLLNVPEARDKVVAGSGKLFSE